MDITKFYADPNEQPLDRIKPDGGFTGIFRTIACVGDSLCLSIPGASTSRGRRARRSTTSPAAG